MSERDEISQGKITAEQIEESLEYFRQKSQDSGLTRDEIDIMFKDKYSSYPVSCTTAEFLNGIQNAEISDEDKKRYLTQFKEAMEAKLSKEFDKEEMYSSEFLQEYSDCHEKTNKLEKESYQARREFEMYEKIGKLDDSLRSYFIEGSDAQKSACTLLETCAREGNLNALDEFEQRFPGRLNFSFRNQLTDVLSPKGLNEEELKQHKDLLHKYVTDRATFQKEREEKGDKYFAKENELKIFQQQARRKFVKVPDEVKKYLQMQLLANHIRRDSNPNHDRAREWAKEHGDIIGLNVASRDVKVSEIAEFVQKIEKGFTETLGAETVKKYSQLSLDEIEKYDAMSVESAYRAFSRVPNNEKLGLMKSLHQIDKVIHNIEVNQQLKEGKIENLTAEETRGRSVDAGIDLVVQNSVIENMDLSQAKTVTFKGDKNEIRDNIVLPESVTFEDKIPTLSTDTKLPEKVTVRNLDNFNSNSLKNLDSTQVIKYEGTACFSSDEFPKNLQNHDFSKVDMLVLNGDIDDMKESKLPDNINITFVDNQWKPGGYYKKEILVVDVDGKAKENLQKMGMSNEELSELVFVSPKQFTERTGIGFETKNDEKSSDGNSVAAMLLQKTGRSPVTSKTKSETKSSSPLNQAAFSKFRNMNRVND